MAATEGWHAALDVQNELIHSFQTAEGNRYLTGFAKSLELQAGPTFVENGGTAWGTIIEGKEATVGEAMRYVVRTGCSTALTGEPMWVADDVVELVQDAAESFQPEAIIPSDLIVERAFALLEKPLVCQDYHGSALAYRAVSWQEAAYDEKGDERGIVFALWSHCDDADDSGWQEAWEESGHAGAPRPTVGGSKLILAHVGHMPYGHHEPYHDAATHYLARQLQVMWRLAKQQIVVPGRWQVPRYVWRRKNNKRQIKHVTVLTLRRALNKRKEGEATDVHWTHRWAVRGHWRNQYFPSIGMHQQIWIDSFIKGPENLPLVTKGRAIEFVR